jgi:hypothetical protein
MQDQSMERHGTRRYSYASNSWMQCLAIPHLHPILKYAIDHFELPKDGIIRVADLGCSSSANTLFFANLISIIFFKNGALKIQYFFIDLPTNDFNSLFQQIPPLDVVLGGNGNLDVVYIPSKFNQSKAFESNFQLQQPILDSIISIKGLETRINTRLYYVAAILGSYFE